MNNKPPKLPKYKNGMRRTWCNGTWKYIPIEFPDDWNRDQEYLIWDEETDNWERISKKNGSILNKTKINYILYNLRARNRFIQERNIENQELSSLFEKISYNLGNNILTQWTEILKNSKQEIE